METAGVADASSNASSNTDSVSLFRSLNRTAKELAKIVNKITVEELFTDKRVVRGRQMLYNDCLNLLHFPQLQRQAIEILWHNCFYLPIHVYKLAGDLDEEDRAHLKLFISASISTVSKLIDQYSNLRPELLVNLGDLHRYSYTFVEQDKRDLETALDFYRKSLNLKPENGHSLNQMALLLKEENIEKALSLFLRASIVQKPFGPALKSLRHLSGFKNQSSQALHDLLIILLFDFGRLSFESARKQFDELYDEFIEQSEYSTATNLVHIFSLATIHTLLNDENDEKFRYAVSFLFRKWNPLLDFATRQLSKQNLREDDEQFTNKRRKRNSSSSSSDDVPDIETPEAADSRQMTFLWGLLTSVLSFLDITAERFSSKKLPVALKFQFQSLLKMIVDVLNELLPEFLPLLTSNSDDPLASSKLLADWFIDGPFVDSVNEEQRVLAARFVLRCINGRRISISFNKIFQLNNNGSEEKELKSMEAFSKMHLLHITEMKEKSSKIPVYVAPDFFAFCHKLSSIEQLLTLTKQTIIITRSVLNKLDKIKRENNAAREAIRWIQGNVPKGRIRMLTHTGENFLNECLRFLEDKGLKDKKTLFCSILTTEEGAEDKESKRNIEFVLQYKAIEIENIDDFLARILKSENELV